MTGRQNVSPRPMLDTVLGPIKVIPDCKAQAVCVNGLRCWEAGVCLRARMPDGYPALGSPADALIRWVQENPSK